MVGMTSVKQLEQGAQARPAHSERGEPPEPELEREPDPAAQTEDALAALLADYKEAKHASLAAPGDRARRAAYREKKRQYKQAKKGRATMNGPSSRPFIAARRRDAGA